MTDLTYRDHAKKVMRGNTNHTLIQLIRYGFVVMVAFPIDFGLLYVFTDQFHLYYVVSAILAFSISMLVNYLLSIRWVFSTRGSKALWAERTAFAIIGFMGLGLTALLIWVFTSLLGFQYLISKLIAVVFVFSWSFFARKRLIFSDRGQP